MFYSAFSRHVKPHFYHELKTVCLSSAQYADEVRLPVCDEMQKTCVPFKPYERFCLSFSPGTHVPD
jgi:hypothetical protein